MMRRTAALLVLTASCAVPAAAQTVEQLVAGFRNPPPEARMRMFWRIFGPAWNESEIDYQLGLMRDAGIGGVMTFPFYPIALDDPARGIKNERYLSPEFLKTFGYAARKTNELGMRFGVAGGTGWPYGGPTVAPEDVAQKIRRFVVPPLTDGGFFQLPPLKPHEKLIAAFRGREQLEIPPTLDITRLSSIPPVLYIAGPTGMQVKRPALGAEGPVIDHYSRQATSAYLDHVGSRLAGAAPGLIDTLFCDSLEVYGANWTPELPLEFKKRRGYDLIRHLPQLFDANASGSPDIRFDYWRTLAEMNEERFTRTVSQWSRSHGVKLEMEAYGTPPNPLTAFRMIDVPCGEQYEWKGFSFSRYAASGAHLAGKKIVSAEAWTWTGIPNRMADSLADLKLASDYHFLAGINDLIGVDFPYSPRDVPPPGWLPYYGPFMNQNNPQWPMFKYLTAYVNRCQWMLRQGKPVAEVAIYLPVEDKLAHGPVEQMPLDFLLRDHFVSGPITGEFSLANAKKHHSDLIHTLLRYGLNYDGIDFWTMNRVAKVQKGRLKAGDGDYGVIILPNVEGIDLQAVEKIAAFVRSGGTLIATKRLPDRAYGRSSSARDSSRVREIVADLFGISPTPDAKPIKRGKGTTAFVLNDVDNVIRAIPDSSQQLSLFSHGVSAVHRRTRDADIFFFVNVDDIPHFVFPFFSFDYAPEEWDPITGEIRQLHFLDPHGFVDFNLQARGSTFLVFNHRNPNKVLRRTPVRAQTPDPLEISKYRVTWHVTFTGPDAPPARDVTELTSWTTWPGGKYFSGQATYTSTLTWNEALPKRATLAFERVREAAEVRVNGSVAGGLWLPPYEIEIAPFLKHGENRIEITVGNLPLNRYLGLPDEDLRPLRSVYGNRFPDPQEKRVAKEPAPSGLIGLAELWVVR